MAWGQAAKISLFRVNIAPQNIQKNAQLMARGCQGRAKPWEEKLVPEEPRQATAPPASSSLHHPTSFPGHQLATPFFPAWYHLSQPSTTFPAWYHLSQSGSPFLPSLAPPSQPLLQDSARRSHGFIFIYYYSLLLFIYSLLFLFHFEHAQLCHLGSAENVNKKEKKRKAAFKCSLSLHEYISYLVQLLCSHPGIRT